MIPEREYLYPFFLPLSRFALDDKNFSMTCQLPMRHFYLLNSLAATFFWVYFLSDGFQAAGLLDGVYELQAHALAKFQLWIEPGPKDVFYFDVCLYNGKYYFYQGLLPSLLHAALMTLVGRVVSSYLVTIGFLFSFIYFFQRIIGDILENALKSANSPFFWLKLGSLPLLWLFLFNLPFPVFKYSWFFGRFAIYEQQIIFALAVMMPAIFLLMRGLKYQKEHYLCTAAFLCSLAAWARVTWLPLAVFIILAAYFYSAWNRNGKLLSLASRRVIYWQVVSIFILGCLLWLNYLRFDSFFEFGQKHLNPANHIYLRNMIGTFSPVTKFWNFIFNIFVYYGSPDLVKGLGLMGKSSSYWEMAPTSYFHYNPQFLPILLLAPLGVYKAFRKNWDFFLMMVCIGLTAIYMNLIITAAGPFCILRYFIEFYYFVLLLFFMIILVLIPHRFALPAMILLLCVSLPGNFLAFSTIRPELRLVDPGQNLKVIVDETYHKLYKTPFMSKNPVWFKRSVSSADRETIKKYNGIGVYPGSDDMILGQDMAALYIVPGSFGEDDCPQTALIVKGLKSIGGDGTVEFYLNGSPIGYLRVNMKTSTQGCIPIEKILQRDAPYQILMVFIPGDRKYLPPRPLNRPVLKFKTISLQTE